MLDRNRFRKQRLDKYFDSTWMKIQYRSHFCSNAIIKQVIYERPIHSYHDMLGLKFFLVYWVFLTFVTNIEAMDAVDPVPELLVHKGESAVESSVESSNEKTMAVARKRVMNYRINPNRLQKKNH